VTRRTGRFARFALATVLVAVSVAAMLYLWPARLGGSSTLVVVRGDSMLPTYRNGDLVVARATGGYHAGDVVVYRVPDGQPGAGSLIIHRLREIAADGTIVVRGDNRDADDALGATHADIVGSARLRLPAGGLVLFLLSRWWMFAVVVGTAVTTLLWPARPPRAADEGVRAGAA
jgi:signal peptidase I